MSGKTECNFTYRKKLSYSHGCSNCNHHRTTPRKKPFFSSRVVSRQPSVFLKSEPRMYRFGSTIETGLRCLEVAVGSVVTTQSLLVSGA